MATNTTKFNFKKPDESDFYSIQDQNGNWDKVDAALDDLNNPGFEDYTGSATVPSAAVALEAMKTKRKIGTLFSNIKAFCKGCCTLAMIVDNCVTNRGDLPGSARQLKVLMDLFTQLNSEIGAIVANPKTKLLIKYGNTSISSNPDGTFQLTHGLGVPCVVIARFGGANARYITFGGDIDPNNAYGVVRETTGEGYAFSGYIFWVAIGFVAK